MNKPTALQHGATANHTYLFPYTMPDGSAGYVYLMCARRLEHDLHYAIRSGTIPTFARVITCGRGEPDERLRFNMERYYGHIHEHMIAA